MPVNVLCPACRSKFVAGDHQQGKRVLCPQCRTPSVVPVLAKVKATCPHCHAACMVAGVNAKKPVLCPSCKKTFKVATRSAPPKPAPSSSQIQPRPCAAPAVTPLAPVRPSGMSIVNRKIGGFPLPVVLGAGLGAVLLVAVVGTLVSFALSGSGDRADVAAASGDIGGNGEPVAKSTERSGKTGEPGGENAKESDPQQGEKGDPPRKAAPPEKKRDPLPEKLSRETLQRVKDATVMFRVRMANGEMSEGSGFFCFQRGLVFTNAHVLGMLKRNTPPRSIQIIYRSGQPDSRTFTGQLLDVDPTADLAILRINDSDLPDPLAVAPSDELYETQKVYIFGFPLGSQLGKNITVVETTISSLRKDPTGHYLEKVQVNGGMNPGNSGGPVVNTRGEVVGVAVSGILGTNINFAVPGDHVQSVLDGRLYQLSVRPQPVSASGTTFDFKIRTINPLNRIMKVGVEGWVGNPGKSRPPSRKRPPSLPGDGPVKTVELTCSGTKAEGQIALPPLSAGKVYWIRPFFVNAKGEKVWMAANTYSSRSGGGSLPGAGRIVLRRQDRLDAFSGPPSAEGRFSKVYQLFLHAGRSYTIELFSSQFDPIVGVVDSFGDLRAADDDGGPGLNSRLVFQPQRSGSYNIVVTTFNRGEAGQFLLIVREQ